MVENKKELHNKLQKKTSELEMLFGKQKPTPYYRSGRDAYIRKVRILNGELREQAGVMGLKDNDLVLVTSRIEKVDASPVDFLLRRCRLTETGPKHDKKITFDIVGKIKDGDYECHGCKIDKQLTAINLPKLCNQDLVLCPACIERLLNTLTILTEKGD